jgi:SAM-dependent methyltransferase
MSGEGRRAIISGRFRRNLALLSSLSGLDPRKALALRHAMRYLRQARTYKRGAATTGFPLQWSAMRPVLSDWDDQAGVASGHYFHQDLWAARKIYARRPAAHVDIGSRIDGFIAHVLTFMPVVVVDIRRLESRLEGLTFVQGNAQDLSGFATDSVDSLSSLHAIEHFGLGRYGDPLDARAWEAAVREFARILRPGGRLYFSVPVGVQRVEFNAHRIFAPRTILDAFASLELMSFSAVNDAGNLEENVEPAAFAQADYACGLFEFSKRDGGSAPPSGAGIAAIR